MMPLTPNQTDNKPFKIQNIFASVLYTAQRETPMSSAEKENVKNITEGIDDSHILNTIESLATLREFCEQHIRIYVNEIIKPKYKLDFYITQSWQNIFHPGGTLGGHTHPNSIISGVFYVSAPKDDQLFFHDPHWNFKHPIEIEPEEFTPWNSQTWPFPVNNNDLLLFPSWLAHEVQENKVATTDRISISFNVHAKGMFGSEERKNELILK